MADLLTDLEALLRSRREEQPSGSYSATLVTDPVAVQRKIMEEAFEVCLELGAPGVDRQRTASEAADLVFHLLAGLVGADVAWADVLAELQRRRTPEGGGR